MWAITWVPDALWAVFPILLAVLALRPVSTSELLRYSRRFGLAVNAETRSSMERVIRRSRMARLSAAAIGLSAHSVLYAFGASIPNQSSLYGILGYLVGAFGAALIPSIPRTDLLRASLVPRRPSDYLPRIALRAPGISVAVSAAAVLAYYLEPRQAFPDFSGSTASTAGLGISALAAVATFVAVHIVVARPQPVSSSALVAVDDAMRTQAVHTLAGTGIAIAFIGTASCMFEMGGASSVEWVRIIGIVGGVIAFALVAAGWALRRADWQVARSTLQ